MQLSYSFAKIEIYYQDSWTAANIWERPTVWPDGPLHIALQDILLWNYVNVEPLFLGNKIT